MKKMLTLMAVIVGMSLSSVQASRPINLHGHGVAPVVAVAPVAPVVDLAEEAKRKAARDLEVAKAAYAVAKAAVEAVYTQDNKDVGRFVDALMLRADNALVALPADVTLAVVTERTAQLTTLKAELDAAAAKFAPVGRFVQAPAKRFSRWAKSCLAKSVAPGTTEEALADTAPAVVAQKSRAQRVLAHLARNKVKYVLLGTAATAATAAYFLGYGTPVDAYNVVSNLVSNGYNEYWTLTCPVDPIQDAAAKLATDAAAKLATDAAAKLATDAAAKLAADAAAKLAADAAAKLAACSAGQGLFGFVFNTAQSVVAGC